MSMIDAIPLLAGAGGDYQISRSVRLRSSASAYFNRTPAGVGNQQKFTWSAWLKRGSLGTLMQLFSAGTTSPVTNFAFYLNASGGGASAVDALELYSQAASTANGYYTSQQVLRDPSAWYHIVLSVDTTQATAGNRVSVWVNNQIVTLTGVTVFAQNTNTVVNSVTPHKIAASVANSQTVDGYLTEINFIDGQALTPSSFGETNSVTGVWQPKRYAGTYGTNGFYLNFSDNSGVTATTIGKDYSGNGNNWTPSAGISITAGVTYDSMLDVPTLTSVTAANYAILNPLDVGGGGTFSDGNLKLVTPVSNYGTSRTSFSVSSGKWYWEVTMTTAGSGDPMIGIVSSSEVLTNWVGNTSTSYSYNQSTGKKFNNGTSATYGASYTNGDVIGVALDLDSGTITFYKNNTSQGTAYTGLSGTFAPAISDSTNSFSSTFTVNFGQQGFTYTPPTGFVALNTQNLPTPTISNGATVMAATTYTGTGSAMSVSNAVNNVSFQPDWVWIKQRNNAANHVLADAIRGVDKYVFSNLTNAEATATAGTGITAFNSNGFSLGTETSTVGSVNAAGGTGTYVAWQWNAGGSTVTNTSGSISSQVRANPTAGFSVVTYTGNGTNPSTVGHGLGVAPKMMIFKDRSGVANWPVYHASLGNTSALLLDTTGASTATVNWWNNTSPTSSVFTIGSNENPSGRNHVAYCFAAVAGYSAFGSYTGNGSTDGPFVFLGFRPRWIMFKRTDVAEGWQILDTARNTVNVVNSFLEANQSNAEGTSTARDTDYTANGFKVRNTSAAMNASGGTYIYAAFSEVGFKYALGR